MRFNLSGSSVALSRPLLALALLLAAVSVLFVPGNETHAQAAVPAAPTGLAAPTVAHDSVTLSWDDPGDSSITGYQVLRRSRDGSEYGDGEGATGFVVIVGDTGSSATTYADTSVTARTRYVYRLKALNSVGLSPRSSYLNIETSVAPPPPSAPAAPTGLTASSVAHDSVTLSWDDPGDSSISGYQVLRRSRDGSEYGDGEGASGFVVIVDDTGSSATTYTDTSVTARTRYVYRVKAINSVGLSPRSSYLNIETSPAPPSPSVPAAPTGLIASSVAHDSVTLSWDDPVDSTITGYQVLRLSRDGAEYRDGLGAAEFVVIVDDTGSPDTTYTDTSVTPRTRYVYRVKAKNPQGLSEVSSPANGETQAAPVVTPQTLVEGSRPNVVLILADDLGWGDILSNNPDSAMTTPRIDSIAAAGANFTDAHSPSSMCSPTRYGLLTGRYAWRTWLTQGVLNGYDRPLIGPGIPTLGTLLRGHGYRTAAVGKWHLGMDFARLSDIDEVTEVNRGIDFDAEILDGPTDHGFDEFFGVSANFSWHVRTYIRDNRFIANPDRGNQPASGLIRANEILDRVTEEAVGFIKREGRSETPFFLYLALNSPHVPMAPNAQFAGQTGLGLYGDVVAQIDWTVGQVLDALERVGVRDDTLVIFTSDNGSYMGGLPNHMPSDHTQNPKAFYYRFGTHQSNGGWSGLKGTINEGGHRVPLLIQWPREIEAGSTIAATVSLTDLYATLADILGEESEAGVAPDSVSLLPLLRGEAATRGTPIVHHSGNGMFALRDGRWKLVLGNGRGSLSGSANGEPFGRPWRLYDLDQDHREFENVARVQSEVMARLEATLNRIRSAEDGTLSADATLSKLRLAGIDIGAFDPDVWSYSATVDWKIETIEVTALPTDSDAGVSISTHGGRLLYGKPLRGRVEVGLADPATTITVKVIAADGSATANYRVTVTRVDKSPNGPTITGTAQVGETLTADTSGITDSDGLDNATFNYQWICHICSTDTDTDIQSATAATYTLVEADEGKAIKVRVSFTDDIGNAETRTSAATAAVIGKFVWESELTAGRSTHILPVRSGYAALGDRVGALSPDSFEIDGTTYRVQFLLHASQGLWLGVQPELPADFTLIVGDSAYLGSESMVPKVRTAAGGYWWPSASPDWLGDDPVEVGLIVHPGVALGDRQKAPVTGRFQNFPTEHDWIEDFTFRIYFSEGVATTADALRDHVLSVTGGAVSTVESVVSEGKEGRIWAVSVTPESSETITIRVEADLDCALPGAVCTADGRRLYNRMELTVKAKENNPPTGVPTIKGTVGVGETLAADTSRISDADGLTGATFSYQWVSDDGKGYTGIRGATGPTYTTVPADEGKAFKVRVSFTDDAGYRESLTSAQVRSKRPYGLNAAISDGGVVLTWKPPVGWAHALFQILRNRPELGEAEPLVYVRYTQVGMTTYTDTDVEPGVLHVYRVKRVNLFGIPQEASDPIEIRTAESTTGENRPATGAPTIGGTVQVGETLTVDTSGIFDADRLTGATFSYQWVSFDGNAYTDIRGATDSTYTLVSADEGKAFKVRVSFTDDAGYKESLTSALFGSERSYGLNASESDGAVALTWKLPAGWPHGSTFQILRNRPELGETAPLVHVRFTESGANAYTDTNVEPGVLYVYRVKGVDPFGFPQEASEPVEIRTTESTAIENTPATGDPTISGTVQVGETLTTDMSEIADEDGLDNVSFSYQWLRDDGSTDVGIAGETNSTYVLDPDDEGKAIKVRVSFTDDAGNEETLTSAPTAQVVPTSNNPAMGLPTIKGQSRVGATLRASLSALDDPDGLSGATFTYQWLADDAEIRDATDSTYVLDTNDEGKTIRVRVSFTDAAGNEETLTSVATSVVERR